MPDEKKTEEPEVKTEPEKKDPPAPEGEKPRSASGAVLDEVAALKKGQNEIRDLLGLNVPAPKPAPAPSNRPWFDPFATDLYA